MSAYLARAEVLLAQSRPADAERETLRALAQNPEDARAHAYLALCRVNQDRAADALEGAQRAVALAAGDAVMHRILAIVLHRLGRHKEAMASIDTALSLDPGEVESHVVRAVIFVSMRQWNSALQAAEAALAIEPENVEAANFRSVALVSLGRKEEAALTVDHALRREPDNALSHANQGWNSLHRNDPRAAKEHFREALRLDPTLEYAREGMLEALKARNPIYRFMLAYYLWMGRQTSWLQWALIVGIFFGGRVIRTAAAAAPGLSWLFMSLLIALYVFIYLSWTAHPMFNLMLRLDRFGRHALSPDQRTGSTAFGLIFAATLASLIWWQVGEAQLGMLITIQLAILSLCVAAIWTHRGRNRLILAGATALLAVIAVYAVAQIGAGSPSGKTAHALFVNAFIGFQVLAMSLRH